METSSFEPPKKKRKHKNENWKEDVTNKTKTADKKAPRRSPRLRAPASYDLQDEEDADDLTSGSEYGADLSEDSSSDDEENLNEDLKVNDVSAAVPSHSKKPPNFYTKKHLEFYANVFKRPSVLKRLEPAKYVIEFEKNERDILTPTTFVTSYINQLVSDMRSLAIHQHPQLVFAFLKDVLRTKSSSILTTEKSINVNTFINDNIGFLIVDLIVQHIKDPAPYLYKLGEYILGQKWYQFKYTFLRINHHLLNMGAVRPFLKLIGDSTVMTNEKHLADVRNELFVFKHAAKIVNLMNKETGNKKNTKDEDTPLDHYSQGLIKLLCDSGKEFTNLLPMLTWYLDTNYHRKTTAQALQQIRDENIRDEKTHRNLINYLKTRDFKSKVTQKAMKQASTRFPYQDFAVDYCQGIFQKDECFDETEEEDIENLDDLEEVAKRLFKYFDCSCNMSDEKAWGILVNTTLILSRISDGRQIIRDQLIDRLDWWFDQLLDECSSFSSVCLGKILVFIKRTLGESTHYYQIKDCLISQKSSSVRVDAILTEVENLTANDLQPIISDFNDYGKEKDVIEEDYTSRANFAESVEQEAWYVKLEEKLRLKLEEKRRKEREKPKNTAVCVNNEPIYFRNFLYMERETQFELLKKYIDEKIDSQAVAVEQSIFERNMVEETPLDIIISDELPHFPYVRETTAFINKHLDVMSQYIDWSGLPELETFCERSELNDFFKNKFLESCSELMYTKLNPKLEIKMAAEITKQTILKSVDDIESLTTSLNQLKILTIEIITSF